MYRAATNLYYSIDLKYDMIYLSYSTSLVSNFSQLGSNFYYASSSHICNFKASSSGKFI